MRKKFRGVQQSYGLIELVSFNIREHITTAGETTTPA